MKKIAIILGKFCLQHNPLDFNNIYDSKRGLSGTDFIFIEIAKNFNKLGWEVHLFCCMFPNQPTKWENCYLYDIDQRFNIIKDDWTAIISINDPRDFIGLSENPIRLFSQQLNGLSYLPENWESTFDIATSPSTTHLDHHRSMYKQLNKWNIVEDACNYEPNIDLSQKIPGRIIWTSSIDRGGHWIINLFPAIKKRVPHASLRIFYDFNFNLENHETLSPTVGPDILELAQRVRYIKEMAPRLKYLDVEHIGSVSKNQIIEEYKKAQVFAFTCDPVQFTEGFSISTLESLNYACFSAISDADCLGSLYNGYAEIIKGKPGKNLKQWEDTIVRGLTDEDYRIQSIKNGRKFAKNHDFKIMTKQLENLITSHPKYKLKNNVIEIESKDIIKLNIASGPNVFPNEGWINYDREDISDYLNAIKNMIFLEVMPEHQQNLVKYLKNGGNIDFRIHDLRKGFPQHGDNSVDLCYLGQMLEHLNFKFESPQFLKECYRMLKPGGIIRITTPDFDLLLKAYLNKEMSKFNKEQPDFYQDEDEEGKLSMLMFGAVGPTTSFDKYAGHFHIYTKNSIKKLLESCGFREIEFYNEIGKSKSDIMVNECVDMGCSGDSAHSLIVEGVK